MQLRHVRTLLTPQVGPGRAWGDRAAGERVGPGRVGGSGPDRSGARGGDAEAVVWLLSCVCPLGLLCTR